jgi:hypothetical protein
VAVTPFDDALARRARELEGMLRPRGWAFADVPPDPIVVSPPGRELPLRPRCWICGAIRLDYTLTDPETGRVEHDYQILASYEMATDGHDHEWTDRDAQEGPAPA